MDKQELRDSLHTQLLVILFIMSFLNAIIGALILRMLERGL